MTYFSTLIVQNSLDDFLNFLECLFEERLVNPETLHRAFIWNSLGPSYDFWNTLSYEIEGKNHIDYDKYQKEFIKVMSNAVITRSSHKRQSQEAMHYYNNFIIDRSEEMKSLKQKYEELFI